jgi:hypothetical protein
LSLAREQPEKFLFANHVHVATACDGCQRRASLSISRKREESTLQKKQKQNHQAIAPVPNIIVVASSPLSCFADVTYDFSMGRISKAEFKAYQKMHADLWPPPPSSLLGKKFHFYS